MSSNRGSAGGGRNVVNGKGNSGGGVDSIPQASKKMVQSLKEIVNCPELEIYAMLKECNMDPNEAVNRLLSQDPFHEVKSKKEKKKEYKDATDSRSRGGSSTLNRGARGSNDRYGRAILSQFSSNDAGTSRAKPAHKKDSGAPYTGSSSVPVMSGSNWPATSVSEATVESKPLAAGASEVIPSLNQSSGFQSAWSGVPGQLSMADVVKMGRPHGRVSSNVNPSEQIVNHQHAVASLIVPTHGLSTSENYAAKASELNSKSGVAGSQQLPPNDGWPQVEQQTVSLTAKSEPPVFSVYEEPFTMPFERTSHHLDNIQSEENVEIGDHVSLVSSRKMQEESSANPSVFSDNYHNINSYQVHRPAFDQQEVEDASVSAINIQQLSLSKEEEEEEEEEEEQDEEDEVEEEDFPKEADSPAVKIPEHLQVQSIDCSHLSFGSFASAVNAPFSQNFASGPEKSNIEETSVTADAALVGHTETRNVEYYDDEHLRTVSDGDIGQRLAASAGGYDMTSASQSETLKQETVEVAPGNQYSFPPSGNTFENSQQLNPSFSHSQTSSQMQNLPPFSGVMSYSDSLPNSLLPSNAQPVRDAELPYSPFPTAQSMPGKYTGSIPGPTNSMTEAMKTGNMASPQPEQNHPGNSIAGAPGFPHLAMHPYSQPSLPFANMIGYPFLPQSYTYMPSAFQQAIAAAGNSTYHQSLAAAAAHPQYKNSVSGSNLPQSAAVPSGYGPFGSSTNVPGNFPLNPSQPPAAPSATSMSYEELLNSQYKDAAHLLALQQGLGSRTMSAVPASAYYSLQGQTQQQPAGYRQTQQLPSQHYSNVGGYPNFYHSQAGLSMEAQQQMSREQSLGGSQGQQQPKQPQQMWPNGY